MIGYRFLCMTALLLFPVALQAADPFLGKWTLDAKRSKYLAASCPQQMTIEMTPAANGVHYHSDTLLTNGTSFSADYTADYDDVPTLVSGAKGVLLPVSLHRVSPSVVIAKYMSGLETRATSRRIVSPDGNTMTVTTSSRDGSGHVYTNIGVYKKSVPSVRSAFAPSKDKGDLQARR